MAGERTEPETVETAETVLGHGGAREAAPAGAGLGPTIGRFTVVEPIGSGGMGVVVAAHDPHLDRHVALKLVRGDALRANGRERLLREGQAMARLSHPNVLTVHEAGTVGDDVFLVMELVDGRTLRDWIGEQRRGWREVLDVFIAAGRGLAAAHAEGLVHRDFKPDNVLIGDDGRVRVMDFGLVASEGTMAAPAAEGSPLATDLTHTGAVMGTPFYMSPEQHLGEEVDAATDQWAFCVSLYEALWGRPPFEGKGIDELRAAVLDGRVREPEGGAPASLRRIVLRGLRRDPRERHPSMDALLAELAAVPVRRRNLALGAAGASFAAAIALAFVIARPEAARPCRDSARHLEGVWDDAARERLRDSFAASKLPYAAEAAQRIIAALDTYTRGWVDAHVATCEATAVHREQSPRALDLRMACLDRRLGEAEALVHVLGQPGGDLEHAVTSVAALAPVSSCDDAEALAGVEPPPAGADPAAVRAVEDDLAQARAEHAAGRYADAESRAAAALKAAQAGGFRALEAEAQYALGKAQDDLGSTDAAATLLAAALGAERVRADALRADAWTLLARVDATVDVKLEQAERDLAVADAAVARLADDHRRDVFLGIRSRIREKQARFDDALADLQEASAVHQRHGGDVLGAAGHRYNTGGVLAELGRFDEAIAELEVAREMYTAALGADHPRVSAVAEVRAWVLLNLGRYDEAVATQREALRILEASVPADSMTVISTRLNLANFLYEAGRYDEALPVHEEALVGYEKTYGADNAHVAFALNSLAATQAAVGRYDDALASHQRALAIREKAYGPDHTDVAESLRNIGWVYATMGRGAEGVAPSRRAVEIVTKSLGAEHPKALEYRSSLGNTLRVAGKLAEARKVLEEVARDQEKVLGADHPDVAYTLDQLAELLTELDRPAALAVFGRAIAIRERTTPDHPNLAIALVRRGRFLLELGRVEPAYADLTRALPIIEKSVRDPEMIAEVHFRLALAEWARGQRADARAHMQEALAVYDREGMTEGKQAAEAWLRAREKSGR